MSLVERHCLVTPTFKKVELKGDIGYHTTAGENQPFLFGRLQTAVMLIRWMFLPHLLSNGWANQFHAIISMNMCVASPFPLIFFEGCANTVPLHTTA